MPLDSLLAECESQSVPGVFFWVQTLKHPEDAALECRLYAGTIVSHPKQPFETFSSGRNMNARRRCAAVFDGISNQMMKRLGQSFEVSHYNWQRVMRDRRAAFCD